MKCCGFLYCERKKSYFCDKHEEESNVRYRSEFIKKYFDYEKDTYRWVHLNECDAIMLEEEEECPLLKNVFYEFEVDGKKIREYHVDTHQSFCNLELKKSIRSTSIRPILMIGQDESVYKQYSFSRKCWFGPDGETKLLPKSDGYSRMVSAFVSRDFGLGIKLSKDELKQVNERRMSNEWGFYLSKNEAKNVYGSTKKKEITDKLTLVRFFNVER